MQHESLREDARVFLLPENAQYYQKTGRFERSYVAGGVILVATVVVFLSAVKIVPGLLDDKLTGTAELSVAALLISVGLAVALVIFVVVRILGPGPTSVMLNAEGLRFEFSRRSSIDWQWTDPRFRMRILRVSRALPDGNRESPPDISVQAVLIPHIRFGEPVLAEILSAARSHGLLVAERSETRYGGWYLDRIELRSARDATA